MSFEIRKIVSYVEDTFIEGGKATDKPVSMAGLAVVMAMIYAWGPLSGLHINPAVTVDDWPTFRPVRILLPDATTPNPGRKEK